jgi:hypothetical protein
LNREATVYWIPAFAGMTARRRCAPVPLNRQLVARGCFDRNRSTAWVSQGAPDKMAPLSQRQMHGNPQRDSVA